jgi:glycosyltransferase involved in cell wall biosynthesis
MKTLGICIPTYERPALLRRCVLSAVESAQGRPIRIFIADDSVAETNDAVYAELRTLGTDLHVRRNARNLGIDANIQRAVDICDRDHAWLIGEDDVFLPGAVATMHDLLQRIEVDFVFANYVFVGDDATRPIGRAIDELADGPMALDRFLADHLWAAGFLGACVVRRATWGAVDPAPYDGTYYTHVGRICEMVAAEGRFHVVGTPCVANRVEGHDTFTWKGDSYGVFFGFLAMCRAVAERRPELADAMRRAGDTMERRYRWLSLRVAARLRSDHGYDRAQFERYLRPAQLGAPRKLAFFLISVAPPALFRPLVRAYRTLTRLQGASS